MMATDPGMLSPEDAWPHTAPPGNYPGIPHENHLQTTENLDALMETINPLTR
jgi:hypothetical protein